MGAPPLTSRQIGKIFHNQIARTADDAAFLWVLRASAVKRSDYFPADVAALDQRIHAHLDLLATTSEAAWEICTAPEYRKEAGETFVLAALAFRSSDTEKIQRAVRLGLANDAAFKGLVSAMGWLPEALTHPWQDRLLVAADPDHRYLALAACSVRRDDPQQHLTAMLRREDCVLHPKLHARALRLAGELKRVDLLPLVHAATRLEDQDVRFWSQWSAVMLGDKSAAAGLQPFVFNDSPYRQHAIQLCFRALPMATARAWLNTLAKEPANARLAIDAAAALGDPIAVEWLMGQMTIPALARAAGDAFTLITGVDLQKYKLVVGKELLAGLGDESSDDLGLPYPDVDRIAAMWEAHKVRFKVATRYFMGDVASVERARYVYMHGAQRQRRIAALELAVLDRESVVLNAAQTRSELA